MVRLRKASEQTGCEILGKCGFSIRQLGEGPRRAVHRARRRSARTTAAGRHHRRRHGWQHRDRFGAGRGRAGYRTVIVMPERRVRRKEGHAASVPSRAAPGAGGAVPGCGQLRARLERVAANWRTATRTEPCGRISLTTSPTGGALKPPGQRSGADRRRGRRIRRLGRHRRHARRRSLALKNASRACASCCRSARLGALPYTRTAQAGRFDHRGHRSGRITKNLEGAPIDGAADPRRAGAADHLRPAGRRRPGGRLHRHQRRRSDCSCPSARSGHTIVTMLCDYGTRYQSKLFNPEFLRAKGLPVPAWME